MARGGSAPYTLGVSVLPIRLYVLLACAAASLLVQSVYASAKTAPLAAKLSDSDFRVRTSAVLALGASKDADAVKPLCGALTDTTDVVRQSAAAALKKLAEPDAVGCLESRESAENAVAVQNQIRATLTFLRALPEPPNPRAKYYVALGPVSTTGDVAKGPLEDALRGTAKGRLKQYGTFQLAAKTETAAQSGATIKKRNLKGFYLTVNVKSSKVAGGTRFVTNVAMFTYPAKTLRGTVSGAAVSNAPSTDSQALSMAFEGALESFADNVGSL